MKNKLEQYIIDFMNARIERNIMAIAADEADYDVRKELRTSARLKVIRKPFEELFTILRSELESEQGLSEEPVFPEQLVTAAVRYLFERSEKLGVSLSNLIPGCWASVEVRNTAELPKVLAYMGAMWLTRKGPAWATKKFRRAARCRNIKFK